MRAFNTYAFSVAFMVASATAGALEAVILDGEMDRDSSFDEIGATMDMTYGRVMLTEQDDAMFRVTAASFDMMPASYYQAG